MDAPGPRSAGPPGRQGRSRGFSLRAGLWSDLYRLAYAWLRFFAIAIAVAVLGVPGVGYLLGFRLVLTDSLPPGLWRLHTGPLVRNEFDTFCLPEAVAEYGVARGYIERSWCPGHAQPLVKKVVALAGDRVVVERTGLTINGQAIPGTPRPVRDSEGRPLRAFVRLGCYTVAPGTFWGLGTSARSWDSRIYGPIAVAAVYAVAEPIWVSPRPDHIHILTPAERSTALQGIW